jgi:hypothetical protein
VRRAAILAARSATDRSGTDDAARLAEGVPASAQATLQATQDSAVGSRGIGDLIPRSEASGETRWRSRFMNPNASDLRARAARCVDGPSSITVQRLRVDPW